MDTKAFRYKSSPGRVVGPQRVHACLHPRRRAISSLAPVQNRPKARRCCRNPANSTAANLDQFGPASRQAPGQRGTIARPPPRYWRRSSCPSCLPDHNKNSAFVTRARIFQTINSMIEWSRRSHACESIIHGCRQGRHGPLSRRVHNSWLRLSSHRPRRPTTCWRRQIRPT